MILIFECLLCAQLHQTVFKHYSTPHSLQCKDYNMFTYEKQGVDIKLQLDFTQLQSCHSGLQTPMLACLPTSPSSSPR